jgi:hypothetical protein
MRGWLNGRPDHERQVNRRFFLLASFAQHKKSMAGARKLGYDQSYHNQNAEANTYVQNEPRMLLEKPAHKLFGFGFRCRTALAIVVRWTLHVVSVTNAHKQ